MLLFYIDLIIFWFQGPIYLNCCCWFWYGIIGVLVLSLRLFIRFSLNVNDDFLLWFLTFCKVVLLGQVRKRKGHQTAHVTYRPYWTHFDHRCLYFFLKMLRSYLMYFWIDWLKVEKILQRTIRASTTKLWMQNTIFNEWYKPPPPPKKNLAHCTWIRCLDYLLIRNSLLTSIDTVTFVYRAFWKTNAATIFTKIPQRTRRIAWSTKKSWFTICKKIIEIRIWSFE